MGEGEHLSADIMGEGGSDGYGGAGVEMPCVWGDWLPLGRVARKGKTGMTDQILMKRMNHAACFFCLSKAGCWSVGKNSSLGVGWWVPCLAALALLI